MRTNLAVAGVVVLWAAACGGDDAAAGELPYMPDQTRVIGGDRFFNAEERDFSNGVVVGTPDGDDCVEFDELNEFHEVCVEPQTDCGDDGRADVLLDAAGAVVDVICYPVGGVAIESYEGPVRDVGNNVVLVLDDEADGVDVAGDVTIDGNNVTLYGHGPDVSVIGGDLNIDKNNALVSGVRVQGDVVIDKNNPSLVDCVIEGDLTIKGNNVSVALCEVWGKLTVEGNNAILVSNWFAVAPEVIGLNLLCHDNLAFADEDGDGAVSEDEVGESIACTNKVGEAP